MSADMSRIGIVAALPGELRPLVKDWQHTRHNGVDLWQRKFDQGAWRAACGGVGADAATRAFAAIEREGPIDSVISYGWVGALTDKAKPGMAVVPSGVIDARTGERFRSNGEAKESWMVTTAHVVSHDEKRRLAERYSAEFVDMEAATVARLATMRDLPFYLCRGVSDGVDDLLPDFNQFCGPRGEFQMAKFVAYAAIHPRYWPALMRMGENSKKAAVRMAEAVLGFFDERGKIRNRNGYSGTDPR